MNAAMMRRARQSRILAASLLLALAFSLLAVFPLRAVESNEMLADPALEARARNLSKDLRCLVCQNQSIDDSEAPLARDLRLIVRERLKAGDTDKQVVDFLVARYGEFVLLKPRLSWHTVALWGAPPVTVLVGIVMLIIVSRRRRNASTPETANLTLAEESRLAELLRDQS
jgi:cytochrome c-type biogenesis protein CcmH